MLNKDKKASISDFFSSGGKTFTPEEKQFVSELKKRYFRPVLQKADETLCLQHMSGNGNCEIRKEEEGIYVRFSGVPKPVRVGLENFLSPESMEAIFGEDQSRHPQVLYK